MDIWLDVAPNEMHYVASIIPTLKWRGGKLGVRLALLPKDVSNLFNEYREAYSSARTTEHARVEKSSFNDEFHAVQATATQPLEEVDPTGLVLFHALGGT